MSNAIDLRPRRALSEAEIAAQRCAHIRHAGCGVRILPRGGLHHRPEGRARPEPRVVTEARRRALAVLKVQP